MHRQRLLSLLNQYSPVDKQEQEDLARIIQFVEEEPHCFEREPKGHVTGSAWLLNPSRDKVLLTFHKKLQLWIQLGGHAEGNPNVAAVALKEAIEESGIREITPISKNIFHIAIHTIPAFKDIPVHFHYDITFLLQAAHENYQISDESEDLCWFTAEQLRSMDLDPATQRLVRKWLIKGTN